MEQMGGFLVELASATAVAAAGAVGTAVGGPIAGAAAGVAAEKIITSFLRVQDNQLRSLEAMNQELGGRLAQIEAGLFQVESGMQKMHADIRIQLEEPWRSALAYLDHAAEPGQRKTTRIEYLRHAREKLFEAHSIAKSDVRQALIAQRLAAIAIMLDDQPSARKWLIPSYPVSTRLVSEAAGEVEQLFEIEWNSDKVANILSIAKSAGLRTLLGSKLEGNNPIVERREIKLPESSPIEAFWGNYIASFPSQRQQINNGQELRPHGHPLENSVQVRALRRLHQMANEISELRDACLRLDGKPSEVPLQSLFVDILPLRRTRIFLIPQK
jgi:hypothetical protein